MSVKLQTISQYLESFAPLDLAEPWDNVGLLLGDAESEIRKVLVALDVTDAVVDEAIAKKVDLIFSHHPLIFSKINKITTEQALTKRILRLIQNNINVYCAHTNLDTTRGGTNDVLADLLAVKQSENPESENSLGCVGILEENITLKKFAQSVKNKLHLEKIIYIGDAEKKIKKVAIVTGSGGDLKFFDYAKKNGCDVLVTSDVKYHNAQIALEMDLCLIDATHYSTEVIIVPVIRKYLQSKFSNLEIFESDVNGQVVNYI